MTPLRSTLVAALLCATLPATSAQAFFIDGDGHYGLRGETRTNEAFSKKTGTFQAIEQTFRLTGEARFNDQSSMFLQFRLFDNPRESYLGDTAKPRDPMPCTTNVDNNPNANPETTNIPCEHQSSSDPGYEPYTPRVTQAYVRYAFDHCLIEAGRRPRQWGLGIFMDAGDRPFATDASVYDGVTCHVNLQKTQALGFSVGYDKLAETGAYVYANQGDPLDRRFGANDSGDDLDQYFFTIEYDDRKANAGASFTKQIGVYFAQVNSKTLKDGGSNTDLKFLDLYTGFHFLDLSIRNELFFRMGKSADPNWQRLGGSKLDGTDPATQKLNAIALAGDIEWTLSRSGAPVGPTEYNKGDASRHVLFLQYAYAPGDNDGYLNDENPGVVQNDIAGTDDRDNDVKAVALHRNYKPALILFNGRPETDRFYEDGSFDPGRVMNASLYGFGYRYESQANGNFEVKLLTASLNSGAPAALKDYYKDYLQPCSEVSAAEQAKTNPRCDNGTRPPGFFGNALGYELDLAYGYKVGREAELGAALGAALPGDAWKVSVDDKPTNNFVLQTYATFKF